MTYAGVLLFTSTMKYIHDMILFYFITKGGKLISLFQATRIDSSLIMLQHFIES